MHALNPDDDDGESIKATQRTHPSPSLINVLSLDAWGMNSPQNELSEEETLRLVNQRLLFFPRSPFFFFFLFLLLGF
jgi:hypothetical protein